MTDLAASRCAVTRANHDPDAAWLRAIGTLRAARAEMEDFHAKHVRPANVAHRAGLISIEKVFETEQVWAPFAAALADAITGLAVVPAPSLFAVLHKIEEMHRGDLFDGSATCSAAIECIIADIRRLIGEAGRD